MSKKVNLFVNSHIYFDQQWQEPVATERKMKELLVESPNVLSLNIVVAQEDISITNSENIDANYIAFPWATYIDIIGQHSQPELQAMMQNVLSDLQSSKNDLNERFHRDPFCFSVCQHIYFHKIIPILKRIGVKILFTPHARIDQPEMSGIKIVGIPLFPVNAISPLVPKTLLYSFVGAYDPNVYLSDVRQNIYNMKHPDNVVIHRTNEWHFQREVYQRQIRGQEINIDTAMALQERAENYKITLAASRYALCPSGSGPSSIRFWEALSAGAIPVVLSDQMVFPMEQEIPWNRCVIRIQENQVGQVPRILLNVPPEVEELMRSNCLSIFNQICGIGGSNMSRTIGRELGRQYVHNLEQIQLPPPITLLANESSQMLFEEPIIVSYCCNRYPANFGGVPRFDYQLSQIFPNREWFGPNETNEMILRVRKLKVKHKKRVIVVTDNHLACDIPNDIPVIVVHHGTAQEHGLRNPQFAAEYRDMIMKQSLVWKTRLPQNTWIVSMSPWCLNMFRKHNGELYDKFKSSSIFGTSELPDSIFRTLLSTTTSSTYKPLILGNWINLSKGKPAIDKIKEILKDEFRFEDINVPSNPDVSIHNQMKAKRYASADMFLNLSLTEGFGYSMLDAFKTNLLIVSTDCGFVVESGMPDNACKVVPYQKRDDPEYMANVIREVWNEREKYFGNSRQWFLDNCNQDIMRDKWTEIVNDFCQEIYPCNPVLINVITEYIHTEDDEKTQAEIDFCLNANLENPMIEKVYVYSSDKIPNTHPKLVIVSSQTSVDLPTAVEFANYHMDHKWVAFLPRDVFLSHGGRWEQIRSLEDQNANIALALTCHEFDGISSAQKDDSLRSLAFGEQQNAWICKTPIMIECEGYAKYDVTFEKGTKVFAKILRDHGIIPLNAPDRFKVFRYCSAQKSSKQSQSVDAIDERLVPDFDSLKSMDDLANQLGLSDLERYDILCEMLNSHYIKKCQNL